MTAPVKSFLNLPDTKEKLMNAEPRDKKRQNYILMRNIMDYGMGGLIFLLGLFFVFSDKFGVDFDLEDNFRYMFAGLCLLYGGFRIYRGYKKNYFSE